MKVEIERMQMQLMKLMNTVIARMYDEADLRADQSGCDAPEVNVNARKHTKAGNEGKPALVRKPRSSARHDADRG
jgi:hypothetical protein